MNIGMLWFDNDPKTDLEKKVERAALYYRTKYGQEPTLCYVHPSMLGNAAPEQAKPAGLQLRPAATVLPHHFWIGMASLAAGD